MVLAASLVIATALTFQAGRLWLASHWLDSEKVTLMERGAALVPGDGSAWDRLGRLHQWDFMDSDLPSAIADYWKAVQDDPRSAHFWMDLASAYETSGDETRARDAYLHAKSVYPASAEVAFHYGNFLLREQQYPEAYVELRRAVQTDPTVLPLAISRTWRSSEDIQELLDNVLPRPARACDDDVIRQLGNLPLHAPPPERLTDGPLDEERGEVRLHVRQHSDPADDEPHGERARAGHVPHVAQLEEADRRDRDDGHVRAVAQPPAPASNHEITAGP